MTQAEEVAATLPPGRLTLSPWSFPEERVTIFRLSVALAIHDPQRALQAAIATPADWFPAPGRPCETVRFWIYTFLLLFAFFHAMVMLRLLLLYRLAVAKRSRVKLAAFFCARLPDFRVSRL